MRGMDNKPEPDSLEWWKSVAQGLAMHAFAARRDLNTTRDRLETALNLYADADMPDGLRSALALIVQDLGEITGQ